MAVPASTAHRGIAFLIGLGYAALPAAGPFVALLALVTGRIEVRRSDSWWWLAAALLGLPFALTGAVADGAMQTLQVLAVWLIFRAATMLRAGLRNPSLADDVGIGLIVGLAITLVVGLRTMGDLQLDHSLTLLGAITWQVHPALFAHAMLVLAALLAVVVPSPRLRATALLLGAIAVVVSGAYEAVIAWLVVAIGLRFVDRRGDRVSNVLEWIGILAMLVMASGISGILGVGRSGFLVQAHHPNAHNVFRGTEVASGDWWLPLQVRYSTRPVTVDGHARTGFDVTKTGVNEWARLQQLVTLRPGRDYVLSASLRLPATDQRPGLDGWGRLGADAPATTLVTTVANGVVHARSTGEITVLDSTLEPVDGDWTRFVVRFRYDGGANLPWYAGVVVDRTDRVGARLTFSELQLAEGGEPPGYVPGSIDRGVIDLRASRFPIWMDSFQGISARPWLGWGTGGLPQAMGELRPEEVTRRPIAAHGHNVILATWVERGVVGVAGLVLLALMLALRVIQQRDRAMAVVLAGVMILNAFDTTLLSGGVIYALAGVLGWRSQWVRRAAPADQGVASAAAVRLCLGLADTLAGALAIALASAASSWLWGSTGIAEVVTPTHVYAVLAWPFAASLVGLYPGYGLSRAEELARTARAAGTASAAFALAAMLFPETFGLTPGTSVLIIPFALVTAPALRSGAKRLLRNTLLWGRPVVVLGTDALALRVANYLTRQPGIGLRPVALFGAATPERLPATPPLLGDVQAAWSFVREAGIRHIIVSPSAASDIGYDEVLRRADTRLRYVQFLPDMHGLPASSVVAAPLGLTLGLEVRNQLASGTNRAMKRVMDFVGSGVLLVLLGPALLALAAWIRLDSRGPAVFLSPRIGRYGHRFRCVKFRTMHVDADDRLQHLLRANPALREEYEHFHKLADDPRVTRAGKVLRALSLDELPQLLNVLAGQMSLVGPRPYMVRELEQLAEARDIIFLARPGMTGYWQVDGRNDVSFAERQAMEADYVRNWSVWWDIELLLRTPAVVLDRTGR